MCTAELCSSSSWANYAVVLIMNVSFISSSSSSSQDVSQYGGTESLPYDISDKQISSTSPMGSQIRVERLKITAYRVQKSRS